MLKLPAVTLAFQSSFVISRVLTVMPTFARSDTTRLSIATAVASPELTTKSVGGNQEEGLATALG